MNRLILTKLQYFGHLMQRADSLEKTPVLEKIEGKGGDHRVRWLNNVTESLHMNLRKLQEIVKDRGTRHAAVHAVAKSQT